MSGAECDNALARAVTCHAWNGDHSQIALCPNNSEVHIYTTHSNDPAQWTRTHVLQEHDSLVSGIDWCARTNFIVTSGHDRNSYVWKFAENEWNPTLVILRIDRAATSVKWSPSGVKFAVTSGAKVVPVCHYEQGNDWWVSKTIKKHKSTVLALDWNRNNKFIATASSDFKCRIFSAFISEVDTDEDNENWADIFPKQTRFGALLAEFGSSKGWVESVCWSPSGHRLAFASHDSSMHFVQIVAGESPHVQSLRSKLLPFRSLLYLSEDCIVAAGYDANPIVFVNQGTDTNQNWSFYTKLDKTNALPSTEKKRAVSNFANARSLFDASTRTGVKFGNSSKADNVINTRHQNTINGLLPFWNDEDHYISHLFSSCGTDGRILMWDMKTLGADLTALRLT